ncbi:hypothetical protein PAXRUDRAFT_17565 [Paxillus rubicundulus Ve08.2h10]|uniref:Uncharacterized protein n=1 Tax=Paxillus rubicundulus Ve08.2h10 TaxID=930991 RepID=A0A0D0C2D9_9AGAM|nr:hypothetical protein PAXRUDRAFT_17565 [Paxillus rubicundulus Ve08.2h10]
MLSSSEEINPAELQHEEEKHQQEVEKRIQEATEKKARKEEEKQKRAEEEVHKKAEAEAEARKKAEEKENRRRAEEERRRVQSQQAEKRKKTPGGTIIWPQEPEQPEVGPSYEEERRLTAEYWEVLTFELMGIRIAMQTLVKAYVEGRVERQGGLD